MPNCSGLKLFGLPSQVGRLRLADLKGAIAQELRVPFREAELPWHLGAAELTLAFVPSAIHGPIPGEGRAVLAHKRRLHSLRGPVFEPIRELLHGHEIWIEIDRVHGT